MPFTPKRQIRGLPSEANADLYAIQVALAQSIAERLGRLRYVNTSGTVLAFDDVVRADAPTGGMALLLPAPSVTNQGGRIYVLAMSSNAVSMVPKGGTVNGSSSFAIAARGLYLFFNDATQWFAIAAGGGTVDSAALDTAFGSTRGSILERGAAGWQIVVPGTSGFVWTSNGAGADPSYQAAPPAALPDIVSSNHILASSFTLAADEGAIIPRYHQVNAGAVLTLSAGSTFLVN